MSVLKVKQLANGVTVSKPLPVAQKEKDEAIRLLWDDMAATYCQPTHTFVRRAAELIGHMTLLQQLADDGNVYDSYRTICTRKRTIYIFIYLLPCKVLRTVPKSNYVLVNCSRR